jgi:tRNA modification GTPase
MTIPAKVPEPRKATLRSIVDPSNPKDIIDKGIVVFFPGPHSYTGEDVVELQVHGSIAVIRDILSSLQKLDGYLPAEPGDFTKVLLGTPLDERIHYLIATFILCREHGLIQNSAI